jgi:tol-pal system protein YbgF
MMRFSSVILSTLTLTAFFWINAQAAPAPVVDLNDLLESNSNSFSTTTDTTAPNSAEPDPMAIRQTFPTDQRLRLLEQQIHNLTQMNLPAKVDNLEQQINQLNGEREEQAHAIQQLQKQATPTASAPSTPPKTANDNPVQSTATIEETDTSLETEAPAAPLSLTETTGVQNKTTNTSPSTPEDTGEKAYKTAFDLMMKKQNTQAIIAFKNFLENYPNSPSYTPNAYYWLGELYSTTHQNTQASKSFSLFIQQYPTHAKVPDAMIKLAIMRDEAGEHAQAKQMLQKVTQQFPLSNAAKLATIRLKEMQLSTS